MDVGEDIWLNIALQVDIKNISDLKCLCNLYCVNKSANSVLSSAYFWKLKYAKHKLRAPNDTNLSLREYYVHYKARYYESILNFDTYILVNTTRTINRRFIIEKELQSVLNKISTCYTHLILRSQELIDRNGVAISSIEIYGASSDVIDTDKYTFFLLLQYFIMCKFKMYVMHTLDGDFNPLIVENTQHRIKFIN